MYYNDYICKGFSCFATPSKSVFSVIYYIVSPRQQRKGEGGGGGGGGGSLCKSRIMHTSSIHIMANYNNLFFLPHTHYYINKLGVDGDGCETPNTVHRQNATINRIYFLPAFSSARQQHTNPCRTAHNNNMVCCSMLIFRGRLARANPQTRRRYDPFPGCVASYLFVRRILWADPSYA